MLAVKVCFKSKSVRVEIGKKKKKSLLCSVAVSSNICAHTQMQSAENRMQPCVAPRDQLALNKTDFSDTCLFNFKVFSDMRWEKKEKKQHCAVML